MTELENIDISLPPFRVRFAGRVEPSEDKELVSIGTNDGDLTETWSTDGLLLTVVEDGRWENADTGDHGTLKPGEYALTADGLYSLPDHQSVLT